MQIWPLRSVIKHYFLQKSLNKNSDSLLCLDKKVFTTTIRCKVSFNHVFRPDKPVKSDPVEQKRNDHMTFLIVTMTISTVICACLVIHMLLGEVSKKWPRANGTPEFFDYIKLLESPKFPSVQADVKPRGYFRVRYSYEVNGRKYTGKRLNFGLGERYYYQEEADQFESKLRRNDFSVQYFPSFPRLSVLHSGEANKKMYYFAIGFIMVAGTALSLFYVVVARIMNH